MPAFDSGAFDSSFDIGSSTLGVGFGFGFDPFDSLMNKVCSILSNQTLAPDAYGQKTQRPQDYLPLATNVPCRVSDKALGRPHEFSVDKKGSENFKTIFMRPPSLSDGSILNPHHAILLTGSIDPFTGMINSLSPGEEIFFNVFEVQNPSRLNHHLEIIAKQLIP